MGTLLAKAKARKARPGVLLGERYQLADCLGRGGFGQVWRAEDTLRHQAVALKLLAYGIQEQDVVRFKQEFALLTELRHPHINPVMDFGRDPTFGYYLTAPLVNGVPIDAVTRDDIPRVEELTVQALRALAYLHSRGVYHFDIKPANLLVEGRETSHPIVKVIDFGLAALQPSTEVAGTPSYMAPELFLGQPADGRADLYALGVVLYRCLTGKNPFHAVTMEDARALHLQSQPPPPSTVNPAVPSSWDTFVGGLLAKAPTERHASAAHALRQLALLAAQPLAIEGEDTALAYLPTGTQLIGRNTLIDECRQWLEGTVPPDGAGVPAVVAILGGFGMGKTTVLRRIQYEAQLYEYAVHSLWGPDDPTIEAFAERLAYLLATPPTSRTILILDDLEQMTEHSPAPHVPTLLMTLGNRLRSGTLPNVKVCFGTAEISETIAHVLAPHVIPLTPLTEDDIATYVATVAPLSAAARTTLIPSLHQRTHGCPALVEHLVRELIQRGGLVDAAGQWQASQFEDITIDLEAVPAPRQLLRATDRMLAGVDATALPVLQCLWVGGEPMTAEAIEALCPSIPARNLLLELQRQGWVQHHHDQGQTVYAIATPWMAEAVRAHLLPEEEARWHATIADHCQRLHQPQSAIDHHLAYGPDPVVAHAALQRLCEDDRSHGRLSGAIRRLAQRLEQPLPPLQRQELLFLLARYQIQADQLREGIATVTQLIELLSSSLTSQPHQWCEAQELQATIALRQQDVKRAQTLLKEILGSLSGLAQPDADALRLRNLLARAHMLAGDVEQAEAIYRTTWQTMGQLPEAARCQVDNNELAQCLLLTGAITEAIAQANNELRLLDETTAPLHVASRRKVLAECLQKLGRHAEAAEAYQAAIAAARQGQDFRLLIVLYNGYGTLAANQGQIDEAITCFERALPLAYRIGDLAAVVGLGRNIGHLLARHGNNVAAETQLRAAMTCAEGEVLKDMPLGEYRCPIYLLLGDLARQRKDWATAQAMLTQAWQLADPEVDRQHQLITYRFGIQFTRAEASHDQQRDDEARRWLAEAAKHPRTAVEEAEYQRLRKELVSG